MSRKLKPINFVGPSRIDLLTFPERVRRDIGYALYTVQRGKKPVNSKPLKGFGGAVVQEIVENYKGDTYRVIYTVQFAKAIYVLHCFQKKSKKGKATPKQEMDLVKNRLRVARANYKENY